MHRQARFWMALNGALLLWYGLALVMSLLGFPWTHPVILSTLLILAIHVLEIPLAARLLASQRPATLRMVVGTTLFGLTWWVPARWELYRTS